MKILVTGGSGFIGSTLIDKLMADNHQVINVDKLTYASQPFPRFGLSENALYQHFQIDICDAVLLSEVFAKCQPDLVLHLAAETHVDRSINGPENFIRSNITGTYQLLEVIRQYFESLPDIRKENFRLLHVSTDEVFGDIANNAAPVTEHSFYKPSSPYSASKAASDHLVLAWHRTFGIPVIVSHCSNNYGPRQHPEKLIPLMISNALQGKNLPIYGDGQQIRDWLFVDDHVAALMLLMAKGQIGQSYNIGGLNQTKNIDVVMAVVNLLDELVAERCPGGKSFAELIQFVSDRPGHDVRYAIDPNKIINELGWRPQVDLERGLRKTVQWYLDNLSWLNITSAC